MFCGWLPTDAGTASCLDEELELGCATTRGACDSPVSACEFETTTLFFVVESLVTGAFSAAFPADFAGTSACCTGLCSAFRTCDEAAGVGCPCTTSPSPWATPGWAAVAFVPIFPADDGCWSGATEPDDGTSIASDVWTVCVDGAVGGAVTDGGTGAATIDAGLEGNAACEGEVIVGVDAESGGGGPAGGGIEPLEGPY